MSKDNMKTISIHVEAFLKDCTIQVDKHKWDSMSRQDKESYVWDVADQERFNYNLKIQDIEILDEDN